MGSTAGEVQEAHLFALELSFSLPDAGSTNSSASLKSQKRYTPKQGLWMCAGDRATERTGQWGRQLSQRALRALSLPLLREEHAVTDRGIYPCQGEDRS